MGDLVTLDELCRARPESVDEIRRLIADGRLPAASGRHRDGRDLYPRAYFALLDEGGSVEALRATFEARYVVAADTYGALAGPDELDDAWDDYLAGRYGARFLDPEPESAIRARRLAASIDRLLADPGPDDWRWLDRLRGRVDALAATLRVPAEGADADDVGTYERLIAEPRRRYAAAFSRGA